MYLQINLIYGVFQCIWIIFLIILIIIIICNTKTRALTYVTFDKISKMSEN